MTNRLQAVANCGLTVPTCLVTSQSASQFWASPALLRFCDGLRCPRRVALLCEIRFSLGFGFQQRSQVLQYSSSSSRFNNPLLLGSHDFAFGQCRHEVNCFAHRFPWQPDCWLSSPFVSIGAV